GIFHQPTRGHPANRAASASGPSPRRARSVAMPRSGARRPLGGGGHYPSKRVFRGQSPLIPEGRRVSKGDARDIWITSGWGLHLGILLSSHVRMRVFRQLGDKEPKAQLSYFPRESTETTQLRVRHCRGAALSAETKWLASLLALAGGRCY